MFPYCLCGIHALEFGKHPLTNSWVDIQPGVHVRCGDALPREPHVRKSQAGPQDTTRDRCRRITKRLRSTEKRVQLASTQNTRDRRTAASEARDADELAAALEDVDRYVARVVRAAPPLTSEQASRLRALLTP
jgi:hypothetical protein